MCINGKQLPKARTYTRQDTASLPLATRQDPTQAGAYSRQEHIQDRSLPKAWPYPRQEPTQGRSLPKAGAYLRQEPTQVEHLAVHSSEVLAHW
jgi:hypothetical protein